METLQENINKWKKHEQEYLQLNEQLDSLPKKVSHDVMIPFGKVGFMPGHLVHTNEVLVLLGDNWFALRSSYQAKEIVDRRLKYVREMINNHEQELRLYAEKLAVSRRFFEENDAGDYVEIREEAPVETTSSKKKRIAHKPSSRQQGTEKVRVFNSGDSSNASTKKVSDKEFLDLMSRLDQLDRHDREAKMGLAPERRPAPPGDHSSDNPPCSRKVKWQDDVASSSSTSHGVPAPNEGPTDHATRAAKSILKNRDEITPVGELALSPYEDRAKVVAPVTQEVFRETVLERVPSEASNAQCPANPPKRVSKFAQQRAALKKN